MSLADDKMRIAQLGPIPPPHGGVSMNILSIHDALRRGGHESILIDITNRGRQDDCGEALKPRSAVDLVRLLLTLNCQIVHYHVGGDFRTRLALLVLVCGMLPGKRSVVTFHSGGYAEAIGDGATYFSLRGFAFRSLDRLVGVNPQMMKMFASFGVPEVRMRMILPFELRRPDSAVELPENFVQFLSGAQPFLLSVGGLEDEYLNADLVRAMPVLIRRFSNARLLIAGVGTLEAELVSEISKLGLEGKIMLGGNIDHEVILHLIERADVMLRLTKFDGDSISVREAMFLGTPVIATDNGMRPKGVHLVTNPPGNAEFLAAVQTCLGIGKARASSNESAVSNVDKVIELYREMLEG